MKLAPGNVRYRGYFGENILTRRFTARDPNKTIHEIDRAEIAGDVVGSDTAWQRPYIDNLMFWPCRDLCAGGALRTSAAQSRMLCLVSVRSIMSFDGSNEQPPRLPRSVGEALSGVVTAKSRIGVAAIENGCAQ